MGVCLFLLCKGTDVDICIFMCTLSVPTLIEFGILNDLEVVSFGCH